ncbi:MAG: DUF1805 domain-containing protein [Erysipelotrichaceae bacterium]
MVEIQTIKWDHKYFVGILLKLPHQPIYLITSTRFVLTGEEFNIQHFNDGHKHTAIAVVKDGNSFEQLLDSQITFVSLQAMNLGVKIGMLGRDALVICDAFYQS